MTPQAKSHSHWWRMICEQIVFGGGFFVVVVACFVLFLNTVPSQKQVYIQKTNHLDKQKPWNFTSAMCISTFALTRDSLSRDWPLFKIWMKQCGIAQHGGCIKKVLSHRKKIIIILIKKKKKHAQKLEQPEKCIVFYCIVTEEHTLSWYFCPTVSAISTPCLKRHFTNRFLVYEFLPIQVHRSLVLCDWK